MSEQKANATTQCGRGPIRGDESLLGRPKHSQKISHTHAHARERVYLQTETSERRAAAWDGMKRDRESREDCKKRGEATRLSE